MTGPGTEPGTKPGTGHVPVMLPEVLHALAPRDGGVYLDGTFGGGGYARAVLEAAACTLWAIDRDPEAIRRGAEVAARFPGRLHLLHGRFGDAVELLGAHGVARLDGVVFDLGVSSFQLDDPARGFSFRQDGPLDMRMGAAAASAAELVNGLGETELADALFRLGEERMARRVARAIVGARAAGPIATTGQLAGIVRGVVKRDRNGTDPATRSFQALRLLVNDELGEVERGLLAAARLLGPGGRLVVVSFHSLEDRIVKRFLQEESGRGPGVSRHAPGVVRAAPARFTPLSAGVERPGEAEVSANPRARSARLRAAIRTEAAWGEDPPARHHSTTHLLG